MKRILLLVFFVAALQSAFSQDNIIKKNGDEIKSKVIEIGTTEIKYKKFENQAGPTYVIKKDEVFMIKYENGTKDIINPIKEESNAKPASAPAQEAANTPQVAVTKAVHGYIERVREVQSTDPSLRVYAGNGWLIGPGIGNPVIGADWRFPRKNVFLRGISVGVRASFNNLDDPNWQHSLIIMGGGITVQYYAPIPIKAIQPYFIAHLGVASYERYDVDLVSNGSGGTMWVGPGPSSSILPYGGFGVGCNFMIARSFGFFTEAGYFTTSLITTGLVFKLIK